MSAELLKLSYFPDDGRVWRVEWVYDIQYNLAVTSESVFVATAPFTPEVQKEYETAAHESEQNYWLDSKPVAKIT